MTFVWILVAIFVVVAVATGGVQLWAAFMDRRRGREIERDESRSHPEDGRG